MSKIFVDELAGIANANTVAIPGHVIQVVQGTELGAQTAITSTSYTDVGLSASITPVSTNSKILVLYQLTGHLRLDTTSTQTAHVQLLRGSTSIAITLGRQRFSNTSGTTFAPITVTNNYFDSPATASALTYKIQAKIGNSGSNGDLMFNNSGDGESQITLLEIAG